MVHQKKGLFTCPLVSHMYELELLKGALQKGQANIVLIIKARFVISNNEIKAVSFQKSFPFAQSTKL